MQKLDFNEDGKLVAFTDNGCTDGKSVTTEVKGTFKVSADVVKFILAKEYDIPSVIHLEMSKGLMIGSNYKHVYCFIGNESQQKVLENYIHKVKELSNVANELSNAEDELKRLRKAVDDFNKNARFYERKIKI